MSFSEAQAKAQRVQEELRATVESVRANADLSEAGRTREIATAYTKAKDALETLEATRDRIRSDRKGQLEIKLFGNNAALSGSEVIGFRDAAERAQQLGPDDASKAIDLLRSARTVNDTILVKAIGFHATNVLGPFTPGWAGVLDEYAAGDQGVVGEINEYLSLANTGDRIDPGDFSFIASKPRELQRMHDRAIRELAAVDQ